MTLTVDRTKREPKRIPLIPSYPPFRQSKKEAVEEKLQAKPICIYVHIPFYYYRFLRQQPNSMVMKMVFSPGSCWLNNQLIPKYLYISILKSIATY
ncbi:MAG TPA: hypothetical protein DCY88_01380 [Cyanobacteria bacterium UBA11372]|nr:hypothetical protein [Cyanobacteria bacterium UBA11372]